MASLDAEGHLPQGLRPMFATQADEPFDSPDYIFEAGRPGIRTLALVAHGRVTLYARNLLDITFSFREIAQELRQSIRDEEAVLDGVIFPLAEDAQAQVPALMRRAYERGPGPQPRQAGSKPSQGTRAAIEVFDTLHAGGEPVLGLPLLQRKALLASIVDPSPGVRLAPFQENAGTTLFEAAVRLGMDGCIAKRKESPYEPGKRTAAWVKIARPARTGKLVIGGYTLGAGQRNQPFYSLLLGAYEEGTLRFMGAVRGGLREEDAVIIHSLLATHHAERCPFAGQPSTNQLLYWCEPRVVLQAKFGEITGAGELRFPVFEFLRPDIEPVECTLEALRRAAAAVP